MPKHVPTGQKYENILKFLSLEAYYIAIVKDRSIRKSHAE